MRTSLFYIYISELFKIGKLTQPKIRKEISEVRTLLGRAVFLSSSYLLGSNCQSGHSSLGREQTLTSVGEPAHSTWHACVTTTVDRPS